MHIEYLKAFYEVASARSISKVANISHISQPALSQQIQRLEDCMGFKLLERSNKGVELTEAGRVVEKYAKHMVKAYDSMIEDLSNKRRNNNIIRVDASPIIATYALPCTIYKVKEQLPNYNFALTSNFPDIVEQNIINDICQIGFTSSKPSDDSLAYSKVAVDRLIPVAAHDMSINNDITLMSLLKYPLILLIDKFMERMLLSNYLSSAGYSLETCNILFNLDSTESVKSTIIKGYGISFLPYISVKKELYTKQLKEIQVGDFNLEFDIYIIYKKDKDMCSDNRELINCMKKLGEKSFC
ncbi:MAG: hypothetical protein A2Y21_04640 [Clostridiales bacterium GWC2_40_7]|nr:MAG: hypothetical protein A2Y21_04640 [Clostridiales bacterium GWC2_40_7]